MNNRHLNPDRKFEKSEPSVNASGCHHSVIGIMEDIHQPQQWIKRTWIHGSEDMQKKKSTDLYNKLC